LDIILWHHNAAGFTVTMIHCDEEYRGMMDEVKDKRDIDMNYASAE